MNVMYTCDNNYVWLMGISAISLFENNKAIEDITIYLLGESISPENKTELKKIAEKYGRRIVVVDVPKLDIPPSLVSARWPLSAFTRLFAGMILPEDVDTILYIDCDTIISGEITELEKIDFRGNIALGVKDCISGAYKRNIGLNEDSPYINAGVILFDVNRLRRVDIAEKIEAYMKRYMKLINYADQDILNGIFMGRIGELDPKYNVMTIDIVHSYNEIQQLRKPSNFYSEDELRRAKMNPAIIHYTTNMRVVRPWFSNTDHPFSKEFEKYRNISVWNNRELSRASFVSIEAKVISLIMKLPKCIAYRILGLIHAELKPRYIRMRAKR